MDRRSEELPPAQGEPRRLQNPNAPLSEADDFQNCLQLSFYVENFGELVGEVCKRIAEICPQKDYLMRFWQIKHYEDPEQAEKVLAAKDRDSYDRRDNFNVYGLFVYFALKARNAFLPWAGQEADGIVQGELTAHYSHLYNYELLLPVLLISLRSKSETIRALALETTQMLVMLKQGAQDKSKNLLSFQTDEQLATEVIAELFATMGERNAIETDAELSDNVQRTVQNTRIKTLVQIMRSYTPAVQLQILDTLLARF